MEHLVSDGDRLDLSRGIILGYILPHPGACHIRIGGPGEPIVGESDGYSDAGIGEGAKDFGVCVVDDNGSDAS